MVKKKTQKLSSFSRRANSADPGTERDTMSPSTSGPRKRYLAHKYYHIELPIFPCFGTIRFPEQNVTPYQILSFFFSFFLPIIKRCSFSFFFPFFFSCNIHQHHGKSMIFRLLSIDPRRVYRAFTNSRKFARKLKKKTEKKRNSVCPETSKNKNTQRRIRI